MTDIDFITSLQANLAELGDVTVRPMMGEYLLYLNGKYVAVICDNTVFVKSNPQNTDLVANLTTRPPYQGAKPCFVVPNGDVEFLRKVIYHTYLGAPEPKKKR